MQAEINPTNNKWQNVLLPIFMFFLLYLMAHLLLNDHLSEDPFIKQIAVSLVDGAVLGIVNALLSAKRKGYRFWYEFLIFWGTYFVVQVISAILFYGIYPYYGASENSIWYGLCYWFPQMFVVMFTIPGAVVYQFIGYIACRRCFPKQ